MFKNSFSLKKELTFEKIIFTIILVIISAVLIRSYSTPLSRGFYVALFVIALGGLANGPLYGLLTGLFGAGIGFYLKLTTYNFPALKKASSLKFTDDLSAEALTGLLEKFGSNINKFSNSINKFSADLNSYIVHLEFLKSNMFFIILGTIAFGLAMGFVGKYLLEKSSNYKKVYKYAFSAIFVGIIAYVSYAFINEKLTAKGLQIIMKYMQGNGISVVASVSLIICLFFILNKYVFNQFSKFKLTTNKIVYMAIFISLSVVINTLRVGSISFGGFSIIYSGLVLGPIEGFIVGGLADLIGFIIRPSAQAFNPIFTITSALTGLIPVVIVYGLGDKYPKFTLWKLVLGIFVGQFLTSVIIVPVFTNILFKLPLGVTMTKAAIKQLYSVPAYAIIFQHMNEVVSKVIKIKDSNEQLNYQTHK